MGFCSYMRTRLHHWPHSLFCLHRVVHETPLQDAAQPAAHSTGHPLRFLHSLVLLQSPFRLTGVHSSQSPLYCSTPSPIHRRRLTHCIILASSLARSSDGRSIAARTAMMAMTTKSSMSVKPSLSLMPASLCLLRQQKNILPPSGSICHSLPGDKGCTSAAILLILPACTTRHCRRSPQPRHQ
jgi:hypothetical protein